MKVIFLILSDFVLIIFINTVYSIRLKLVINFKTHITYIRNRIPKEQVKGIIQKNNRIQKQVKMEILLKYLIYHICNLPEKKAGRLNYLLGSLKMKVRRPGGDHGSKVSVYPCNHSETSAFHSYIVLHALLGSLQLVS